MDRERFRQLAVALLNDDEGISEFGYILLRQYLVELGLDEIVNAVEAAEGRYFLPEDF